MLQSEVEDEENRPCCRPLAHCSMGSHGAIELLDAIAYLLIYVTNEMGSKGMG